MLLNSLSVLDLNLFMAYIDPGFGSMQLQIVIASFLSATFFLKSYCSQAKVLIGQFLKK